MSFWENVVAELEYKGINRKTLALEAKFDASNIGKGLKNGNIPSADTAVRIANVLGVSVEYLVTGKDKTISNSIKKEVLEIITELNYLQPDDLKLIDLVIKRLKN